ncbi:Nn.00g081190.m01.CDS01 [Neocucurbitaria sp. VM-36]
MSDGTSNVIPPETASIISAYMSQAEDHASEGQGLEADTRTHVPLINRKPVGSPISVLSTSTQSFPNDSVISPVSRSDSVRYEQVPKHEQGRTRSVESTTNVPTSDSDDHTPEKPGPGTLRRSPFQWWFLTPMDVLLAFTPLFFLIVACLALSLNNRPTSKYGSDIRAITLFLPTVFPIVYAAILGKMLRRIGLFKAERSATIGTIERLIGCQSLFSAFERQLAFRRVDLLGATILIAWLLSPLGGQSSLRLLSTKPRLVESNDESVMYYPIEGYIRNMQLAVSWGWFLNAPIYTTALITAGSYMNSSLDMAGYVRIPRLASLPTYVPGGRDFAWHEVGDLFSVEYSSLFGIPVAGLPEKGNTTFTITSHYWSIDCEKMKVRVGRTGSILDSNTTFQMRYTNGSIFQFASIWYPPSKALDEDETLDPLDPGSQISETLCVKKPVAVESKVACEAYACAVQEMRMLNRTDILQAGPSFAGSLRPEDAAFLEISMGIISATADNRNDASSDLVEHWLLDPNLGSYEVDLNPDSVDSAPLQWVELSKVPTAAFNQRLEMAINTYWDVTLGVTLRKGNITRDRVKDFEMHSNTEPSLSYTWNTTGIHHVQHAGEQYVCHVWFAVITIAISLFLVAAALVALILGILTKAPDTLGYVSTSARDNPYVTTQVASHLDGLEAARELRNVRIRIGDVNSTAEVGHVAFASMDTEPGKVSRKRLYN